MLILTRKENEKILIDEEIEISIVEIKGNKVKIGINAPEEVEILREEVYKSVKEENIEATKDRKVNLDKLKGFGKNSKNSKK
ncbi:MAG TPA: carbon storage regulator CsrA [Halanaerobiales bacterium]|nr:carbon storage regulator CsrA [Halanaerobiales bacterium]